MGLSLNGMKNKVIGNFKKHQVAFSEAVSIWLDSRSIELFDSEHSYKEERWIRLGLSYRSKILTVVYCVKVSDHQIRLISARMATLHETKQYFRGCL
ncbi:MAG: BrnT family toxin [Bdellovibrionota bacterium]